MNATTTRAGTRLLSIRAAAEQYGIPRASLTKLLEGGYLRPVRLPRIRRVFVDREDVEALIASQKQA